MTVIEAKNNESAWARLWEYWEARPLLRHLALRDFKLRYRPASAAGIP